MELNPTYFVNAEGREAFLAQQLNHFFEDIDSRLVDLEYHISIRGKKPSVSRAEKMALLHELGVLDHLMQLDISQKKVAHLLHTILNDDASNIEKDLSARHNKNCLFKKERTYQNVVKVFNDLGLEKFEAKSQQTLNQIESENEK